MYVCMYVYIGFDIVVAIYEGQRYEVELKYTTTNKVRFSPHQILFHTQKSKRNFLLLEHAPKGLPSTIKLYESKSIEGLLLDHREVKPIAINDWSLIQNKLIGVKN